MGTGFGSQSMVDPLRTVLVGRPTAAFAVDDPEKWGYPGRPDLAAAQEEHDSFVGILRRARVEVLYHDEIPQGQADAIFVHDPAIIADGGAIILRMGKALRRGEEEAMARRLEALGVPLLTALYGEARAEGGDLVWLDHETLAVGQGFRTNAEGLRQLTQALQGLGVTTVAVPLPYHRGPEACLHLMSFISMVAEDLAVVYTPLMPVPFWQYLKEARIRFVEVPDEEFETMGPNVLAISPDHCLMLEGNPITKRRLEEAGFRVSTYRGNEISLKGGGGPTCLTRPILRER